MKTSLYEGNTISAFTECAGDNEIIVYRSKLKKSIKTGLFYEQACTFAENQLSFLSKFRHMVESALSELEISTQNTQDLFIQKLFINDRYLKPKTDKRDRHERSVAITMYKKLIILLDDKNETYFDFLYNLLTEINEDYSTLAKVVLYSGQTVSALLEKNDEIIVFRPELRSFIKTGLFYNRDFTFEENQRIFLTQFAHMIESATNAFKKEFKGTDRWNKNIEEYEKLIDVISSKDRIDFLPNLLTEIHLKIKELNNQSNI